MKNWRDIKRSWSSWIAVIALGTPILLFVALTFWGQCVINFVAAEGNVKLMGILLEFGENPNRVCKGTYPLISAVRSHRSEMVSYLLKNGANPEIRDAESSTPLIWAAKQNDILMARKLIESGANINSEDRLGASSLWYAVRGNDFQVVAMLLNSGAKIKAGPNGITPLSLARQNNNSRVIRLLSEAAAERADGSN
jgi:ankyrin repeat protein